MKIFDPDPAPLLSADDVAPAVRSALGDPGAQPLSWSVDLIYPTRVRVTGGVYRCRGEAMAGGRSRDFSAVLKVLRLLPWQPGPDDLRDQLDDGGDEPGDIAYWLREALVYRDSLLPVPGSGLRAPDLLAWAMPAANRYWLWLEDVSGAPASGWDASRWSLAAEHLGQFQGYFALNPPPPRDWYAPSFESTPAPQRRISLLDVFDHPATWDHPVIGDVFAPRDVTLARRIGRRRRELTATAMAGPQTLCHRDLSPGNLFADPGGQTIAIDWMLAGTGPLGEDLANLFCLSAGSVTGDYQLADYEQALLGSYASGLRAAGWTGDQNQVRTTFRIVCALRLGILIGLLASDLLDPAWCARVERRGIPLRDVAAARYAPMAHALRQAAATL